MIFNFQLSIYNYYKKYRNISVLFYFDISIDRYIQN